MLSEFVVPGDWAETWKQAAGNNIGMIFGKTSSFEEEEYTEMIAHEGFRSIFLASPQQFLGRNSYVLKAVYAEERQAEQTNTT